MGNNYSHRPSSSSLTFSVFSSLGSKRLKLLAKIKKNKTKKKQETWKFHEYQVLQLLHETRKTFQGQSIELMYFSFNNINDI